MALPIERAFLEIVTIISRCMYVLCAAYIATILLSLVLGVLVGVPWPFAREDLKDTWKESPKMIGAALLWAGMVFLFQTGIETSNSEFVRLTVGTGLIILFSVLLFLLKLHALVVYGLAELCFAVFYCRNSLDGIHTLTGPSTLQLFASIYLMIRAFDNIRRGLIERDERKKGQEAAKVAAATSGLSAS